MYKKGNARRGLIEKEALLMRSSTARFSMAYR